MGTFDAVMREVLGRPKYNILTGRRPDIGRLVSDALGRLLGAVLERLNMPEMAEYNTDIILYIFFAIAALLLVTAAALLYRFFSRRNGRARVMDDIYGILEDKAVSYEELLARADSNRLAGGYREAVRYRFIAVLYVLNKNNLVYLHKSKTNNQLKRELKSNASLLSPAFDSVVGGFNNAWFGHRPPDEAGYAGFSADAEYIAEEAKRNENTR